MKMCMFQIFKIYMFLQFFIYFSIIPYFGFCFSYIIKLNLNVVNKSIFHILEFYHTTEIINKLKTNVTENLCFM
jgi:hypothetical protein